MPFCSKCGKELAPNAQFCANCGAGVAEASDGSTRQQSFVGKINKCPSCGEVLPSGILKCPSCGMEIRGAQSSDAAKDFFNQINRATTYQQRIDIIKTYPIPSTREDILLFLNRAKSEVENDYDPDNVVEKSLHDAWLVCFTNLKNRVVTMPESDRAEFDAIISSTNVITKNSTRDVDNFRIALAKYPNPKDKINLIKSYPIKANPDNLLSLVTFMESQIEFKNPVVQILKTLGLALLYIYTLGIAYLIISSKRKKNGTVDYTKQMNNAWFVRLKEVKTQSANLLNDNPAVKEKLNSAIKKIERRKLINTIIYAVVIVSLVGIYVIGILVDSKSNGETTAEVQSTSIEEK